MHAAPFVHPLTTTALTTRCRQLSGSVVAYWRVIPSGFEIANAMVDVSIHASSEPPVLSKVNKVWVVPFVDGIAVAAVLNIIIKPPGVKDIEL